MLLANQRRKEKKRKTEGQRGGVQERITGDLRENKMEGKWEAFI